MCSRIINFATKYEILNDAQHGFRKGRSTVTAIGSFISNIIRALENKESAIGILYDFSKAFDTINHKILLEKLTQMGISGNANKWIASFLRTGGKW
jgi:sarcosine oxidase/L-pipecolate oxidase